MAAFFDNYFNVGKLLREKRAYRQMMARVNALPEDYRYVFICYRSAPPSKIPRKPFPFRNW